MPDLHHRRAFLSILGAGGLAGCSSQAQSASGRGVRVDAHPAQSTNSQEPGSHSLNIRKERDSILYIPKSMKTSQPAPLVVYLHGAGGNEQQGFRRMGPFADEFGFALLSPASAGSTWDAIQESYGPDVRVIEKSLSKVFTLQNIDPKRIAVAGFSDGASYALGIGLSNGELFKTIVSFSAGFVPGGVEEQGKPRIFMSHGTADNILPISNCSRRIAPALKSAGYKVEYREFDGPHTVPREIGTEAFKWFLEG